MRQPGWKKWLSYFYEWPIETVSSDKHEMLQVLLIQGQYQLVSPNAIYSYGVLYTNFLQAFKQLDIESFEGKNVLVLGLGLGSIPQMLETRFLRSFHYTIVEFDEAVIELAHKYVLQHLSSSIEVIHADAFVFIDQHMDQYDMICMDIFFDDLIPSQFEQKDFLLKIKSLLTPKGLFLYNRLALTMKDREKSQAFFDDVFLPVFPKGKKLKVGRNWMLVNGLE